MTRTRRQGKSATAGNRAMGGRINSINQDYDTPRSQRRHAHAPKSRRGFAAMDPRRQRKIASLGGRSPHNSPRGFAAMSERQRRQIASQGGRAFHSKPRGFAAMNPREQRKIAARGGRTSHAWQKG